LDGLSKKAAPKKVENHRSAKASATTIPAAAEQLPLHQWSCASTKAKGDHDCAIADFTKAIGITPQDADAYYNRGLVHRAKGKIYAIADYTKAIEINPRHAAAYSSRATPSGPPVT
jgi:tetratricopeptide (TPR) repeat protein